MTKQKKDRLQGTLELLILSVLSSGPSHGYSIARRIEIISKDALSVQQGSLYPALQRLLKKGWVMARWGVTDTNRKARIYELTKAGKEQINEEVSAWKLFSMGVGAVVKTAKLS